MECHLFHFALFIVSAVTTSSACEDLGEVFIDFKSYWKNYERPEVYERYTELASSYHIDLDDHQQLRDFACALVEADAISDISQMLELDDIHARYLPDFVENLNSDNIQSEITRTANVVGIYERAVAFYFKTMFPHFPLELSEEEALAYVREAGEESLNRLLGTNAPDSEEGFHQLAVALSQAQTVDEFSYITYNKYDHVLRDFDERFEDIMTMNKKVKPQPELLGRLKSALGKYNIPDKYFE